MTTVASDTSVANRSWRTKRARSATPSRRAASTDSATSFSSISMPSPRAPRSFAAVSTIRPSPEPMSTSTSSGPTPAISSIFETTPSGEGT